MKTRSWIASAFAFALAGCGGGDGGVMTPVNLPTGGTVALEGAYYGTTTTGVAFDALFLDGGRFYVLYGDRVDGGLAVRGLIEGSGTSNNGSFSSANAKDFSINANTPVTISVSYGTGASINGNISADGSTPQSDSFSALPVTNGYLYTPAAKLSDITGSWALTALTGDTFNVSISDTGALSGSLNGCSVTGTLAPRASGRNVFDVNLSFGAETTCTRPNETATGSAISYPLGAGKRQIVIVGTNTARDSGTALFGVR